MKRINPKKNPAARRKRGFNVVTGYYGDLNWQMEQIRAHYFELNMHEEMTGTRVVHDPVPAAETCILRYEKFYGLNNKYHANGQLKAA